jgi:hypothetical protein
MALAHKSHQSETEREFCEILQMADPIVSRFVSEHEALKRRNEALLERVTVLERALQHYADLGGERARAALDA